MSDTERRIRSVSNYTLQNNNPDWSRYVEHNYEEGTVKLNLCGVTRKEELEGVAMPPNQRLPY